VHAAPGSRNFSAPGRLVPGVACQRSSVWAARALGDRKMTVLPSAEKVDAPDRDAIERVVQLYVDGFNDCDVDKFIQAFHEDAWIFFTHRDGTLYKGLIADSFEEWATPPAQRIVGRVISVTQAGDIASVLLGFDNADDLFDGWVDLHTLLRIDGTWKIMNKTATHCSRAAWAAPKAHDEQDAQV
jgi:ketosteroid isomerase-like protein